MATIKESEENTSGLRLVIRKAKGEEALLDISKSIKKYDFKLNSKDGVLKKDASIMPELTIEGEYPDNVADAVSQFMVNWAMEIASAAYKYVELISFNDKKIRKRYVFPAAFVVDYDENVEEAGQAVKFKLFIKLDKDSRNEFKIYVNEELPIENKEDD